jgi:peptidoglycan/LPS O-acetylase OafA/YrhL
MKKCNCFLLLFFILLINVKSDANFTKCKEIFENYLKNFNLMDITNPLVASGTGYNDFGKYDMCLEIKDSKYYLNKITFRTSGNEMLNKYDVYIGLCVPEECYEYERENEYIRSLIKKWLQLKDEDIENIYTNNYNNEIYKLDNLAVFSAILFLTILMFSSGLFKYIFEYKKNKKDIIEISDINNSNLNKEKNNEENLNKNPLLCFVNKIFDFNYNFERITSIPKERDIKLIYGLKSVSFFIIVFISMSYMFVAYKLPIRNPEGSLRYMRNIFWQFIFNNNFLYDIIFFTSAFYIAYKYTKNSENRNYDFKYFILKIFQKLTRIYPVYIIIFLFYYKFFGYFLDGPISGYFFKKELDDCKKNSYNVFLMLQDFLLGVPKKSDNYNYYCFEWGWFFSAYFHYYIIGCLLMYFYLKNKNSFYLVNSILLFIFITVELIQLIVKKFKITFYENFVNNKHFYYEIYYSKFYNRIIPYLFGILAGIWYANQNKNMNGFINKNKDNIKINLLLYSIGVDLIILVILLPYFAYPQSNDKILEEKSNNFVCILYNFLSRKVFIFGLFLMMLPLLKNNFYYFGGFLNDDCFGKLNKLLLCTYLIHPILLRFILLNARYQLYFDGWYILFYGTACMVLSIFFGYIFCLFFEIPMDNFKKYYFVNYEKINYINLDATENKKLAFIEEKLK